MNQSNDKRRAARKFRFNTHHFSVGTLFTLNDDIAAHHVKEGREVWPVTGIVRNGVDSYVLKTGIESFRTSADSEPVEHGFNIQHVKAIVKRGDGPVLIDGGWYGNRKGPEPKLDKDIALAAYTDLCRKGVHATYSPLYYVIREVRRIAPNNAVIDMGEVAGAVLAQTWCHKPRQSNFRIPVCQINKKRLRRWLKQNINRFLSPLKPLLKAEEEENRKDYEQMLRDDDDWYPEPRGATEPSKEDAEGSCYDAEDGYKRDEQARAEFAREEQAFKESDEEMK